VRIWALVLTPTNSPNNNNTETIVILRMVFAFNCFWDVIYLFMATLQPSGLPV